MFEEYKIHFLPNPQLVVLQKFTGTEENCTQLFVPTQTDVGTGCTFNRIPEPLLRKYKIWQNNSCIIAIKTYVPLLTLDKFIL